MQDDLATTTQTKLLTRSRLETLLIRAAPYLPLLAALLLFVGSLLTWVTVRFSFFTDSLDLSSTNSFDMAIMGWSGLLGLIDQTPFIALARLTLFLWDVFPLAGILLGLILMRQRRVTRPPLTLYGAWLLITTLVFALILAHGLTMTSPFPCAPGAPVCPQTWVVSRGIEAGGWLTLGSLALSWLALGLLIQRQRTSAVIATPPGVDLVSLTSLTPALRYPPSHRLGAVIFTAGAALWAFGLFAVPWATSHCTGLHLSFNHFVRGACGGVDGFDVLSAGLAVSGQNSVISWPLIEFAGITGLFVVIINLASPADAWHVGHGAWLAPAGVTACLHWYARHPGDDSQPAALHLRHAGRMGRQLWSRHLRAGRHRLSGGRGAAGPRRDCPGATDERSREKLS